MRRLGRHGGLVPRGAALAALGATLVASSGARAHEYWLDPLGAAPVAGGAFVAAVRNGEDFAGTSLPYDPNRMARLSLVAPDGARPVDARLGDFPAVQLELGPPGLHLVLLDTHGKELVYAELEKFAAFLDYHGQDGVLDAHRARELPGTNIREHYFRHAKLLVRAAGDADAPASPGTSADAASPGPLERHGQALELVPENDPFAADELGLRLFEDGVPLAGAQVELFERTPSGAVSRTLARTDADGRVRLDVDRPGDYLVNAVRVTEPGAEALAAPGETPHWQSRWAALTFDKR